MGICLRFGLLWNMVTNIIHQSFHQMSLFLINSECNGTIPRISHNKFIILQICCQGVHFKKLTDLKWTLYFAFRSTFLWKLGVINVFVSSKLQWYINVFVWYTCKWRRIHYIMVALFRIWTTSKIFNISSSVCNNINDMPWTSNHDNFNY